MAEVFKEEHCLNDLAGLFRKVRVEGKELLDRDGLALAAARPKVLDDAGDGLEVAPMIIFVLAVSAGGVGPHEASAESKLTTQNPP